MRVLVVVICLFFVGCVSVPPQAPKLSEEIGLRINSIEDAHLNLLHNFFENKRQIVDDFISDEWLPLFAKNFFDNQQISQAWDEIVQSGNKEERLKFIVLLGPRIQSKINDKRQELIQPLDDLEAEVRKKITMEYNQVKSANNAITSYLVSASKVDENRQRYLDMFGITENKIDGVLTEVDGFVEKLVKGGETVLNPEKKTTEYLEKLLELTKTIKTE